MRRALLATVLLLSATLAGAADAPRTLVRARIEPTGPVVAGQTIRLVVDVLVTTWLTSGVELPALDVPGAVVAPSDEQASNLTESIDGASWFGVSRVYLVTPMAAGDLTIPPIVLTVRLGGAPAPVEVRTPPLTITIVVPARPAGAEHALAATALDVTQRLDPTVDHVRVGDSIERTVTVSATGVRGMFLPPTVFAPIAGLALYPAAPRVDDVTDARHAFTGGRRVDAATYVVQAPGHYVLPAVTVEWWDADARALRSAAALPVAFEAVAAPASAPEIALPSDADDPFAMARAWRRPALAVAGVLGILLVAWLAAPALAAGRRRLAAAEAERERRWEASEPRAFERVTESARAGDPAATYAALLTWLARASSGERPVTIETLGTLAGDPELARALAALAAAVYDEPPAAWHAGSLPRRLTRARRSLRARAAIPPAALPPLNP